MYAFRLALQVDGEVHVVDGPIDVAELLSRLGRAPESVAVAVNDRFVPRALRGGHLLHDGDRIACFKPITGG